MAKLVANKYYNKNGEAKINSYFVSISKEIAEKAGFDKDTNIVVKEKNGKIIIEKE